MKWPFGDPGAAGISDDEVDAMVEAARADYISVLDKVLDDRADLARIYAKYGQPPPAAAEPDPGSGPETQVRAVCDRIGMLESALAAAAAQGPASLLGVMYLKAIRRVLFELRTGLAGRRLDEDEALRLLGSARHNIQEAVRVLRADQLAAAETIRGRLNELGDLAADAGSELEALHHEVRRLFDSSGDTALVPVS